jgi:transketolase
MASSLGWDRYAGPTGRILALHTFGHSAPLGALLKKYGFTAEAVFLAAKEQLKKSEGGQG